MQLASKIEKTLFNIHSSSSPPFRRSFSTHSLSTHSLLFFSIFIFFTLNHQPPDPDLHYIQLGLGKMKPLINPVIIAVTFILAGLSPEFLSPINAFSRNSKYEIACTMCDACDNPCQPVYSPPPPSPPPPAASPPPPPPPSQPTNYCPPPPSPKSYPYYSPPPPSYVYQPPSGGGGFYIPPPDRGYFQAPPPPNPIVPYFPFYFYNPPPQENSAETLFRFDPVAWLVIGLVSWCLSGF